MSKSPSWDHLATFLSVMRCGSLSAAARDRGVTQPTVRRQVEELEAMLSTMLFTRAPNGLTPTTAAHAILPYVDAMQASADALVRAATNDAASVSGIVRLTCSEVIAAEVAPALLAPLLHAHPGLSIELVGTDATEDLLRREADVAIRMNRPTQAALVAKHVGDIALGLYAHRSYLADRTAPVVPADLTTGHVLIGGDRHDSIGPVLVRHGVDARRLRFALRTDNSLTQLASIRAGLGIGVCQVGVARRDVGLEQICPSLSLTLPAWVVTHEDLRAQPRIRAVFDRLVHGLAAYVAFAG